MTTATQVRDRPILFSGPMVTAILAGRKTQTRRIVKPQPDHIKKQCPAWRWCPPTAKYHSRIDMWIPQSVWKFGENPTATGAGAIIEHCPYGQVGDRLWVRETWARSRNNWLYQADIGKGIKPRNLVYDWDWDAGCVDKWRPSIHMPRRAARLFLEVTGVRVERLCEISREDAIYEGAVLNDNDFWEFGIGRTGTSSPQAAFADLWSIINGLESWNVNPWVWVIEFKQVEPSSVC